MTSLRQIQKFIVETINADDRLAAAGVHAVAEDKGDEFAEVDSALDETGLAVLVSVPTFAPDSTSAKASVGKTSVVCNVSEAVGINRSRAGWMDGLDAAERVAYLLNLSRPGDDHDLLVLDKPGITTSIATDGSGAIYAVPFTTVHQIIGD